MTAVVRQALLAAAVVTFAMVPAVSAQQATPPKPMQGHGAHHAEGAKAEGMKEEQHAKSGWKELDIFHDVMSAAWHPAKNDSLSPARASADKLVSAAKAWSAATAPKGCDSPVVKSSVAKLLPETQSVAALVARNADDAVLKAALKTVHDTYHAAESACKPEKHTGHRPSR